ncbi:uncharacterized protein LOC129593768 [Paramacrobiotus metropolitanus]|uniref:uncharacterized protein LOC129593768 n=1 Tax=Paramacrobiotus metropolitanus TaxID=2943436 RepID=UPI002445EABB|nr:uncharacterized protein LOC129593768 [Paramacrobiotus metropolitanus]
MAGNGMETPFDVVGNGYTIRHSTEHHVVLQSVSPFNVPDIMPAYPARDSANAPHNRHRLAEQRQLETGVLDLLTHYQLANMESGVTDDKVVTCRAMYTFQKDLQHLQSTAWNDYGQGALQRVREAWTGHEISPLPTWLENGVGLQVYFEKKVATNRAHSSSDKSKRGFEIPWVAAIHLQRAADDCTLTSVQLAFINPDYYGSPTVYINMAPTHATNMGCINNILKNIRGQTYSECCQELGIFREAYCFVTMRVPLRRLLGQVVTAFRLTFADCQALPDTSELAVWGTDKVVLKTRQGDVKTDRQALVRISSKMRAIFSTSGQGKFSSYEVDYNKAVVVSVLHAAMAGHASLPLNPQRATVLYLYEAMKLALSWEIPQLTLWTQLALVERLCQPMASLEAIPVRDAVRLICDQADPQAVGSRMIVCGLVSMLRILHSETARWTLDELMALIAGKPELWKSVIQPPRLVPDTSIVVRTMFGRTFTVAVNLANWVYQLKCRIQVMQGIPMEQQRLVFDGTQLSDNLTLADYGINANSTVQLALRLRGC